MSNNYITDYLARGADPSNEDVFVLSSAIRRAFLHVPSLYDVETVSVLLGHYDQASRGIFLETADGDVPLDGAPWLRKGIKGTYYGNRPESFGPLERDGIHYTDAKPHPSAGLDYAESIKCIMLPDSLTDVAQSPAVSFNVLCPEHPDYLSSLTYYFSGDDRLLHLPHEKLRTAQGCLSDFILAHGELVHFNLLRQRAALSDYLGGDSMAFYESMLGREQP